MMNITKDNAMLLDIQYVRPNRNKNLKDCLYYIYKNLDNGEKYLEIKEEPEIDIYFTKPEYRDHKHHKDYEHLNKLNKVSTKVTNIIPTIAKDAGPEAQEFLRQVYNSKDYSRLKEFMTYPYCYAADYGAQSFHRIKWLNELSNTRPKPLTKGFLDIETDSIDIKGFTDATTCPIDLVTLIDSDTMTSYTFALVNRQIKEVEITSDMKRSDYNYEIERRKLYERRHNSEKDLMDNIDDFIKELHDDFDETYGNIDYKFYFYEDEAKMLVHLLQLVHYLKLDFILIWNMGFDIPYILKRLEVLGFNPSDIMCHKDFPNKQCYYKYDKHNYNPKEKSEYFFCSSYTIWYDQMALYASIRKGGKEIRSLRLTDIGHEEINDDKLDYSEEGDIKKFSYRNYKKYIKYNIKDVLLQYGIERKVNDIDLLYVYSYNNGTPYESVFKQTIKLRQLQYIYYLKQGLVPGNNINIFNDNNEDDNRVLDEEEKDIEDEDNDTDVAFEGALVGNPILNSNVGMTLFGHQFNSIFGYSIDMDMGAFYPSTVISHNIAAACLYFKAFCSHKQFEYNGGKLKFNGYTNIPVIKTNDTLLDDDVAKELFDNFQTGNYISFGHKWMNLPTVADIYNKYLEETKGV